MNAKDLIRNWNIKKGTHIAGTEVLLENINGLINRFGEDEFSQYLIEMADANKETDIWRFLSEFSFNAWKKSKEPMDLSVMKVLGTELIKLMGVDLATKMSEEINNKIDKYIQDKVLTKVVEYKGVQTKVQGVAHEKLDTIIKFVAMNEPVMLVGPAGTGKNVIAKQVADSLNLDFYFSNAVTQEYKLTGYGDANGEYVKTQFFEAFTKGGIFLLDEVDASIPEALIILNCAIANGYFDFPVLGRMSAHPDFRVIACANTFSTGADSDYVGRNQLDAATLNRFAVVKVDYDSRIEEAVCDDKDILEFCRQFRKVCMRNGVHHIVSYREMSRLYKMINIAKLDKEEALRTCLIKGLENDTLRMIYNDMQDCEYKEIFSKIIDF